MFCLPENISFCPKTEANAQKGHQMPENMPKNEKSGIFSDSEKPLNHQKPNNHRAFRLLNICPKTAFLFSTMLEGNLFYPQKGKVTYPPPPQNLFSKPSPSMGPQSFVSFPLKRISAPSETITGTFPQSPSKAMLYKHLRGFPGNKKRP